MRGKTRQNTHAHVCCVATRSKLPQITNLGIFIDTADVIRMHGGELGT